jgi:hypothetical protein
MKLTRVTIEIIATSRRQNPLLKNNIIFFFYKSSIFIWNSCIRWRLLSQLRRQQKKKLVWKSKNITSHPVGVRGVRGVRGGSGGFCTSVTKWHLGRGFKIGRKSVTYYFINVKRANFTYECAFVHSSKPKRN